MLLISIKNNRDGNFYRLGYKNITDVSKEKHIRLYEGNRWPHGNMTGRYMREVQIVLGKEVNLQKKTGQFIKPLI